MWNTLIWFRSSRLFFTQKKRVFMLLFCAFLYKSAETHNGIKSVSAQKSAKNYFLIISLLFLTFIKNFPVNK